VHKHWDRVTGAWKQISKQKRRVNVSYAPNTVTALQHGAWMYEEGFKKTCIREKKKRGDIRHHMEWWAAVTVVAIPSQPALLM